MRVKLYEHLKVQCHKSSTLNSNNHNKIKQNVFIYLGYLHLHFLYFTSWKCLGKLLHSGVTAGLNNV